MDTGAAGVQSVIAVELYRSDIVMKDMGDFANEVCVCSRKSYLGWREEREERRESG